MIPLLPSVLKKREAFLPQKLLLRFKALFFHECREEARNYITQDPCGGTWTGPSLLFLLAVASTNKPIRA